MCGLTCRLQQTLATSTSLVEANAPPDQVELIGVGEPGFGVSISKCMNGMHGDQLRVLRGTLSSIERCVATLTFSFRSGSAGSLDMTRRILVVEDQQDNRQILRDLLRNTGYELVEADDGLEAVAAVARKRPDLI